MISLVKATTATTALAAMLEDLATTGGFSWHPLTGQAPTAGYMVALTGDTVRIPEEILTDPAAAAATIAAYVGERGHVFAGNADLYVGGWIEDGDVWLEPSERIADREKAIIAGQERDQIAIFDVAAGDVIGTGGAGGFLGE